MPTTQHTQDPLRRFRLMAVRLSMIIVMILFALALLIDRVTAQGVLIGGIAGILGFWVIAIRLEKVAREKPSKVQYATLTWSFYRYGLYGLVLYKAFTLDKETYHGLLGALVGIYVIQLVLRYLAITGRDQQGLHEGPADDEDVMTEKTTVQTETSDDTDG